MASRQGPKPSVRRLRTKSSKQRRAELTSARRAKAAKAEAVAAIAANARKLARPSATVPVTVESLGPNRSYGVPDFVQRGFYIDKPFKCQACGRKEVWEASQQRWWYEVIKGGVWKTATRCRNCRRKERERKAEARRVHLEGLKRKKAAIGKPKTS